MNRTTVLTVILFLTGLSAFAQVPGIPYVDIATAKAQVDALTAENAALATETTSLKKEIDDNRASIQSNEKTANDITPILESVKAKGTELAGILANITDKDMRTNALQYLARNKDLQKRLESKLDDLDAKNLASQKTINNDQKSVDVNEAKTQRNKDQIIVLQAAIAKTENQQSKLTLYMKDVDSFLTNAETYLKGDAAPADAPKKK